MTIPSISVYTNYEDRLDEPKRLSNVDKHGMDFADLDLEFFDNAMIVPSRDGRLIAVGMLNEATTVVFAALGVEAISIISMRPASARERSLLS